MSKENTTLSTVQNKSSCKSGGLGKLPKLRFPEFLDAGDWEEKTLGNLVNIKSGISPSRYNLSPKGKYAFLKVEDLNNCDKYQKRSREYSSDAVNIIPNMSVIFPKRGAAIQLNKVRINIFEVLMDTNLMAITSNNKVHTEFLYYIIVGVGLFKIADTSTIPQINNKHIIPYPILTPQLEEQHKIANCLTSVDQLITTHTQKLDTLKSHKKGLMQQLFPAEGKTVPNYRFPEFQDAGDWEEKPLKSLSVRIGDGIHSTPIYNDSGNYHFINGNNLIDGKILISESTKKVDENEAKKHSRNLSNRTILLSINGTIGNLAFYKNEKVMLGKSAAYINLKDNVIIGFIYNSLKTAKVQNFFFSELTGSTIKNLSLKTIREAKISIPLPVEQQKIANCLNTLDQIITAQAEKIEQLKAHKKGLMQQLFPSAEEVN